MPFVILFTATLHHDKRMNRLEIGSGFNISILALRGTKEKKRHSEHESYFVELRLANCINRNWFKDINVEQLNGRVIKFIGEIIFSKLVYHNLKNE